MGYPGGGGGGGGGFLQVNDTFRIQQNENCDFVLLSLPNVLMH